MNLGGKTHTKIFIIEKKFSSSPERDRRELGAILMLRELLKSREMNDFKSGSGPL